MDGRLARILLVFTGFYSSVNLLEYSNRVIRTKYGSLRGVILHRNTTPAQTSIEAFLGIPYAAPPTGTLRYLPPASPGPWSGIRLANSPGPACPQQLWDLTNRTAALQQMSRSRYYQLRRMQLFLRNQSEDCLYLNIYLPNTAGSVTATTPVAVFIHGESYSWGAGHLVDGTAFASNGNVIVVTLNFRLGILGFLETAALPTPGQARGTSKSTIATQGNYGLLDIVAALLWLKDNVHYFGGDSQRISLIGQGTGAALVNLLMISPLASGLFRQAVLMGGSALSPGALATNPKLVKEEVARQMECNETRSPDADIGDCLRRKPLGALLNVQLDKSTQPINFAPFVDGFVIKSDPLSVMQSLSETFGQFPLMAGITSTESFRLLGESDLRNGISEEKRDQIVRTLTQKLFRFHRNEIYHVLRNEYTEWDRSAGDPISMRDSALSSLSDGLVVSPLIHVLHIHASGSTHSPKTFFYHFAQSTEDSQYPKLGSVTGDELEVLKLDATLNDTTIPTKNISLGNNDFQRYLFAFLQTGDPNLQVGSKGEVLSTSQLRWESFNQHSQLYLSFGKRTHAKSHYRGHQISAWLQLLPQLDQPGPGEVDAYHHDFHDAEIPSHEGSAHPSVPDHASRFTTPLPDHTQCAVQNSTNVTTTLMSSEWPPNVMASEEMGISFISGNTALTITLLVGTFFLALNLILFTAIYKQRSRVNKKKKFATLHSKTEEVFESTTDLRQTKEFGVTQRSNGSLPHLMSNDLIIDTGFYSHHITNDPVISQPSKGVHLRTMETFVDMTPVLELQRSLPRPNSQSSLTTRAQVQEITV